MSRPFSIFVTIVLATGAMSSQQEQAPLVARSTSLLPLQMSYADLFRSIERARQLIERANRDVAPNTVDERLTVSTGTTSLEVRSGFTAGMLQGAPETATDVYYRYSSNKAPIEEVTIRLADWSRTISVSGTEPSQVDALILLLRDDLSVYETRFGGGPFRLVSGWILYMIAILLVIVALSAPLPSPSAWRIRIGAAIVSGSMFLLLLFAPWDEWMPGTAVFLGDPRFSVRYAPLIGLVGTVLAIISLLLPLASRFRKPAITSQAEADPRPAAQPTTVADSPNDEGHT